MSTATLTDHEYTGPTASLAEIVPERHKLFSPIYRKTRTTTIPVQWIEVNADKWKKILKWTHVAAFALGISGVLFVQHYSAQPAVAQSQNAAIHVTTTTTAPALGKAQGQ